MVDALARDGRAVLAVLDGQDLSDPVAAAGKLLATVLGQDLEQDGDGVFRIARKVARDRVISTVDRRRGTGTRPPRAGSTGTRGTPDRPGQRDHHQDGGHRRQRR